MSDNSNVAVSETTTNNDKAKITTKDPALKLAHKRLSVLQLAETLGNVKDVKTTMIYTHVLYRGGLAVRSPPD